MKDWRLDYHCFSATEPQAYALLYDVELAVIMPLRWYSSSDFLPVDDDNLCKHQNLSFKRPC